MPTNERVPDSRTHYEIALANGFERNMLAEHRAIDVGEQFAPRYPIDQLIQEYIEAQDLELRHALPKDDLLRRNAVDEIFNMAKDSHEYQPIWEARLKGEESGDFYESDKLVKQLRAKIEQRLLIADGRRIRIFDSDTPSAEDVALLEKMLDAASDLVDAERDAKAKLRAKELAEGLSDVELKGRAHGQKMFEQWLTDPAFAINEMQKLRKFYDDGELNAEGEKMDERYIRGVEHVFNMRRVEHETWEYAKEAGEKAKAAKAEAEQKQQNPPAQGETLDTVIEANKTAPKTEQDERTAASSEKIKAEKEKKNVSNAWGKPTQSVVRGNGAQPSNNQNNNSRGDQGFLNFEAMPDGDQLEEEFVSEEEELRQGFKDGKPLTLETAPEELIYRVERPEPKKPKSRLERMRKTRKENPKLAKNLGNGMQYGIGMARNFTLPDAEEVEVKRVNIKKKPWRWLKLHAKALYRRHRKSTHILLKLTAFVALQLGVSTMAGRFEFKEDRHFVQMVLMTMFGFVLTSSLAKDGVPVSNAALIL